MSDGKTASLGDYLLQEGLITQSQYNSAVSKQKQNGLSLGRIVVDSGMITEEMRITLLRKNFGFDVFTLGPKEKVEPTILSMIPYSFAEKHRAVAVDQMKDGTLIIAMEDPSDFLVVDAIKNQVGYKLKPVAAKHDLIKRVLEQYQVQSNSEAEARELALKSQWRNKAWARLLNYVSFPVLAIFPLAYFLAALFFDWHNLAETVQGWQSDSGQTWFDFFVYILLGWGTWAVIVFEVHGLIFGHRKSDDEL